MSSKWMLAALLTALLITVFLPREVMAADWSVSPFRAQIANAQASEGEPAADSTTAFHPQKKNIGRAVMFSLVIPGAGQMYAGSWMRAVPWFVLEVAGWAAYAHYHGKGRDKTDEFEAYAGFRDSPNHFNYLAYMYAEYRVAHDRGNSSGQKYNGTFQEWQGLTWEERGSYLQPPFTHDVLDDDRQQYFEMIGKYLLQFGWGWQDTRSGGGTWPADPTTNDWTNPGPGMTPDDAATVAFDGTSAMFQHYADMRGEANDLLDKGNIAMEVVLVNHVISALDAAFAVRRYNKRLAAQPSLGDLKLRYDVHSLAGEPVRCLTLSVPLR